MQLVAYGAQDIYLTGNPQITFFKVVYRRHTNFAMELISQTFAGSISAGCESKATISRNGDLVHDCFLEMTCIRVFDYTEEGDRNTNGCCNPPDDISGSKAWDGDTVAGVPNLGTALINNIEVNIGGQCIDKHYGHWMETYNQLTVSTDPGQVEYNDLKAVSHLPNNFQEMSHSGGVVTTSYGNQWNTCCEDVPNSSVCPTNCCTGDENGLVKSISNEIRLPLQFWFCRNPGLALPLIALQYHEVEVRVLFNSLGGFWGGETNVDIYTGEVITDPNPNLVGLNTDKMKACLWCNYIYLDTDERRRFAQVSHEYLIEQVQFQCESAVASKYRLNFNHPVKELVFIGTPHKGMCFNKCMNAASSGPSTPGLITNSNLNKLTLSLNGQDRFSPQPMSYFTQWQVNQYHSGQGGRGLLNHLGAHGLPMPTIGVYSFALKPEEHQPSGTCNFSRIDTAELCFDAGKQSFSGLYVYAVNYNVLRIMSGMGGLAYSN